MMEKLLQEQLELLERLRVATDNVADLAYRLQSAHAVDADLEAFEVKVALDKTHERLKALHGKQRRRQKQLR